MGRELGLLLACKPTPVAESEEESVNLLHGKQCLASFNFQLVKPLHYWEANHEWLVELSACLMDCCGVEEEVSANIIIVWLVADLEKALSTTSITV